MRLITGQAWAVAGAPPPQAATPTVLLEGATSAALTFRPELASELIARALGAELGEPGAGPLTEMERGVLSYVMGRWLADGPWRVAATLPHPAPLAAANLGLRWPLELALADARHPLVLWLPLHDPPPARPSLGHVRAVPIEVAVEIGRATVEASVAGSLRPSDIVIPDEITVDAGGEGSATLRTHGSRWAATIEAGQYRIEHREESAMSDDEDIVNREAEAPVTLTLEVARLAVPLGELAALAPGAVLETRAPIGGPVTLRAGGRAVATGELVDVGGEIGVRITRLSEGGDYPPTES